MDQAVGATAIIGLVLLFFPVIHAARSRDWLAFIASIGLCVAAAATLMTAKSVIHEILAALVWMAAYLGAVLADCTRRKGTTA